MDGPHQPIRVVYFGTPAYAVPALTRLAEDSRFAVVLVVSQPDRPAGRGHTVTQPAVRNAADRLGLRCLQPLTLADPDVRRILAKCDADVFVVAAYGRIFGGSLLRMPRHCCLNLHASLLPKYRGASPVTAAILNGDGETGVTLMVMAPGLDTGPVVAERRCRVSPDDTTGTLTDRLALLAADLAADAIPDYVAGRLTAAPQPHAGATVVRQLTKADGWITWRDDARAIERQTRAMQPWPRAWTTLPTGEAVQVLKARAEPIDTAVSFGQVVVSGRSVLVSCGDGALELVRLQMPGGRPQTAESAIAGRKLAPGLLLGATGEPASPSPLERPIEQPS